MIFILSQRNAIEMYSVIIKLIFVFSPDVRAFLLMDSPKHQSDPSEDEDERSTQKVRGTEFFTGKSTTMQR